MTITAIAGILTAIVFFTPFVTMALGEWAISRAERRNRK